MKNFPLFLKKFNIFDKKGLSKKLKAIFNFLKGFDFLTKVLQSLTTFGKNLFCQYFFAAVVCTTVHLNWTADVKSCKSAVNFRFFTQWHSRTVVIYLTSNGPLCKNGSFHKKSARSYLFPGVPFLLYVGLTLISFLK